MGLAPRTVRAAQAAGFESPARKSSQGRKQLRLQNHVQGLDPVSEFLHRLIKLLEGNYVEILTLPARIGGRADLWRLQDDVTTCIMVTCSRPGCA